MENKKIIKKSKTFCVMPWISFRNVIVDRSNNYHTVCCYSKIKIKTDDSAEFNSLWNSKEIKELRKDFINGVKNKKCDSCWVDERNNVKSNREKFNDEYYNKIENFIKKTEKDGTFKENPSLLDVNFGWACDLKCRMCDLPFKERGELVLNNKDIKSNQNHINRKYIENVIFPVAKNVKKVFVAGGEPFIHKTFIFFLKECIRRGYSKNISIKLVTNLNNDPTKFLKLLTNFKNIKIDVSIDGKGKLYEYIRYLGEWNRLDKNFKSLIDFNKKIEICVTIAVQIYNIFNLYEIVDYVYKMKKRNYKVFVYFNYVYNPDFFCIKNLPKEIKIKTINYLEKLYAFDKDKYYQEQIDNLIKFIKSEGVDRKEEFIKYTYFFDKTRSQSYKNYLNKNIINWIKI